MCLVHKNILRNERKGYTKKYKFTKNGMDDYTLSYKDKTINFNSKVEYKKDLEELSTEIRNNLCTTNTNFFSICQNFTRSRY